MAGDQNPKPPTPIPRQPGGRTTAVLVPQGALAGQPDVPLDRPVTTFGSNDNARLHLVSRTISKGHGIFVNSGGVTYVADLASRTGVLVNGKLIRDVDLKTGDRVQIGKFVFRYRAPTSQAPPAPANMPPAASVIVVGSPAKPVDGRVFQIGRKENSDVSFSTDAAVSAGHAVIFEMDGGWYIRDLGSRTGTTVNGKSIHQKLLNFGDRIQIGSSTILFQPGASAVNEFGEPASEPELQDASRIAIPLEIEEQGAVVADEEAIPLADDLPLQRMDWKSAFPKSDPEPELAAVVPVGTGLPEEIPFAEPATDFAELERLAEENLAEPEVQAEAKTPPSVEIFPEPMALEAVDDPVAEEPAAVPLGSVLGQAFDEASPVEEVSAVEVPAESDTLPLADELIEPFAIDTEASAGECIANDIAEAIAQLGAANEVSPVEVAEAPTEEIAAMSEPLAIIDVRPEVEVPAATALQSIDEPAAIASSVVDDFVFVPMDEQSGTVPEVIFWGDTDIDATVEAPAIAPPIEERAVNVEPVQRPILPVEIEQAPIAEVVVEVPAVEPVAEAIAEIFCESIPSASVETISVPEIGETSFDGSTEAAVDLVAIEVVAALPIAATSELETSSIEECEVELPAVHATSVPVAEEFATVSEPSIPRHADVEADAVAQANTSTEVSEFAVESDDALYLADIELLQAEGLQEVTYTGELSSEVVGFHTVDAIAVEDDFTLTQEALTVEVEVEPDAHESDLEFLDFTEEPAESAPEATSVEEAPPVAEAPVVPPVSVEKPAEGKGAAHGPSIFGFDFEGGSFLGGMPISLTGPIAAPALPAAVPPTSPVFDANVTTPTGIGQMMTEPSVPSAAQSAPARPMTPPRPMARQTAAPTSPTSLSGLVSEARLPWGAAPVIPPTTRDPASGPIAGTAPRRALTSNFTATGAPPRVTEVFSQMSAPIGVEVFGGRPGDPDQFTVPDSKETAAQQAAETEALAPAKVIELPSKKARRSWLPLLLVLLVLIPAIMVGAIYKFVPVSSQIMGSLAFDGLVSQQMNNGVDARAFHVGQEMLIRGSEVRKIAMNILDAQGQPEGFTSDDESFTGVVNSQYLNWSGNTLQFTYNTTNEPVSKAQVNAVMAALAQKDRDLDEIKNLAKIAADAAKAVVDASATSVADIIKQRREMADKAQDRPNASIVADADREAATLHQQWLDAQKIRTSTETALADLRSQDPTKTVDIEADPQVVDLRKQLQPLLDQIAKLKGTSSVDAGSTSLVGTSVSVGATTQPDGDAANLLLAPLQQQADLLSKRLEARLADLTAEANISLDQRQVNQTKAIENLSVKITDLQKAEAEAKAAADEATTKAKGYHAVVSAAMLAGYRAQDLQTKQTEAEAEQARARNDSENKEAALARCITVLQSKDPRAPNPTAATIAMTDMRPKLAIGSSVIAWVLLAAMIYGELRRPKLMTSVSPAAAPRVNPPIKLVPWPQPRELAGLEHEQSNEAAAARESEQVFGV